MQEYEILILSAGRAIAVIEELHFSDHAAIRSGKKFAGDLPFEVWRGLECIHGTSSATNSPRSTIPYSPGAGRLKSA